ncbi:MAG: hypothetical protein N3I35_09845 [Clostridia bacterium]|nr:hypothetical protein [Clostridia bacterium]
MKIVKKFLVWAAVSVVFQLALLWIVNDFYIENRGKIVEVTRYEEKEGKPVSEELKTTADSGDVSVSFDCSYAGYISKGKLQIISLKDNGHVKTISGKMGEIIYFRWLPDRNMVLYVYMEDIRDRKNIHVETYDAETFVIRDYPQITESSDSIRVADVVLSPFTNTVYMNLQLEDEKSKLYKYDIAENLNCIMAGKKIEYMNHLKYTDNIVYQTDEKHIFLMNGKGEISSLIEESVKDYALLGVDYGGSIYIGELNQNKKVTKVILMNTSGNEKKMIKTIYTDRLISAQDIYVSPEGNLYLVLQDENTVYDAVNSLNTKYPGKFIQISGKYIVSGENGKLIFTTLAVLQ